MLMNKPIGHSMRQAVFKIGISIFIFPFSLASYADHASVSLGSGSQAGAPIASGSAIPLAKGQFSVGLRNEYVRFNEFSDRKLESLREKDEEADLHSVESIIVPSVGVAYGVTDDFTVGLKVPYVFRNNIREPEHGHDAGVETLGDAEGLGDTVLFGQYRVFHNAENDTHVSALFGVKAPTGRTNRRSDRLSDGDVERLETELQPGSGSWDGLIGAAFTQRMFDNFSFDTSLLYTIVTKGAQHTDLGDIFSYNLSFAYQINNDWLGASFESPMVDSLASALKSIAMDLVLELNGEWRDRERFRGEDDDNSGGNLIYLSPGIRFSGAPSWHMAVSFGTPIAKNLYGDQVNPDYRIISNINFNF